MSGRRLLLPFLVLLLGAASPPAALAAYGPLWSQPVAGAAQLVADDAGVTVVWAVADGAGATLLAQRYSRAGEPLGAEPAALVSGVSGLSDWLAASDGGGGVIVAWKAGGVTTARRYAASGAAVYDPVTICSDAAVAALRGAGATAAPVGLEPDRRGGAYVRLLATPSLPTGDTLLAYVSPLGATARPDPGLAVAEGTVAGMAGDAPGHLFVILDEPGRAGLAVQRFAPSLDADWAAPVTPYNPLLGPPPGAPQTSPEIVASSGAMLAWREGGKVKLQRFFANGDRLWLRPVAVSASGATTLAGDGWGGCYLVGTSGDGLRVRHLDGKGAAVGDPDGVLLRLGLAGPRVEDVSWNDAGDLTVACGGAAATAGVARMTYLAAWSGPALDPSQASVGALERDGAGGDYALGAGPNARLWRLAEPGGALTLRPRASRVTYGDEVGVAGYLTVAGEPLPDSRVQIRWTSPRGLTRTMETATTDDTGFYEATIVPEANGDWTALAAGPGGETIVSAAFRGLKVTPDVSITLDNRRSGDGYVEIFSGVVKPALRGSRVLVQRRSGGSWRTVGSDSLDRRSRYRVSWPLPLRSATYAFRTLLPADADHAAGVSRTATLRVVVRSGR
jgi:hypothetical protein